MSVYGGPDITTDKLKICLDPSYEKSYNGSGTSVIDTISSINGTLTNGPIFNTDNDGHFILDGTNDYILFDTTQINSIFPSESFSIEMWIKTSNTTNYKGLFCIGYYLDMFYLNNSFFVLCRSSLGQVNSGNANLVINDNKWHQIGFTASSVGYNWFKDGIIGHTVSSNFWNGSLLTTGGFNGIGRPANLGDFFPGSISSFKFYQKNLSSSEILQNYNALKGRFGL